MTSYHFTEDLVQNQGVRTDADHDIGSDDADLSDEELPSPVADELIQGPSMGFVERGKQKADSATAPAKDNKKDPKNVVPPPITQRKTNIPPPKKEPKPANYPKNWCYWNLSPAVLVIYHFQYPNFAPWKPDTSGFSYRRFYVDM